MSTINALSSQLAASPKSAEGRLLDILTEPLDDEIDALGEDAVIAQLHALYDQYVAPADIPWVPQLVEDRVIDPLAKSLITTAVKRIHARIHTP